MSEDDLRAIEALISESDCDYEHWITRLIAEVRRLHTDVDWLRQRNTDLEGRLKAAEETICRRLPRLYTGPEDER